MEDMNLNGFVNGVKEEEIALMIEEANELHLAAVRLNENEDFQKIYKYYTETKVLDESMKASLVPERRPELFEAVINSIAFKTFFEELLGRELQSIEQ